MVLIYTEIVVDSMTRMIEYSRRFELQIKLMAETEKMDESAAGLMRIS